MICLSFSQRSVISLIGECFTAVWIAKVFGFSSASVSYIFSDGHEYGSLTQAFGIRHCKLIRMPASQKDTTRLHRYLRQEGLCGQINTCENLHIAEHPPPHTLHLLAGVAREFHSGRTIAIKPLPGLRNLQHASMNRISGATFLRTLPRCQVPPLRFQEWPKSNAASTEESEIGIFEPKRWIGENVVKFSVSGLG